MNEEIKLRQVNNLIKYKKLKEEVERIINDYHNHFLMVWLPFKKCERLRKECRMKMNEDPWLTDEEEAFYEILASHKNVVSDFELIKEIVKEVTIAVKKNLRIDWV